MKGQRFQDMFILSKTLGAWRVQILPGFKLIDDHQQPVITLIARELTINMEEPAADVFCKWDGNTDSLSRFDDGFGKCLWSSLFQEIIRSWPPLIVALNVVDKVALDPLGRLLPPGLDLISGTYRNPLMEPCLGQILLDCLLQYALQGRMLSLCREAAFAIQDNWEKTDTVVKLPGLSSPCTMK